MDTQNKSVLKYIWSKNDDFKNGEMFSTYYECLEDAKKVCLENGYSSFYIGEAYQYTPYVDAEYILEHIEDQVYNDINMDEYDPNWDPLGDSSYTELEILSNSLTSVLYNWLVECNYLPNVYEICSVEEYDIEELFAE